MIISHITYCLISWSNAHSTAMKPLESLYKQALKTLDKKPFRHHHCHILRKYKLLSWENLITYKNICLVYKIMHGSAPPPLSGFIQFKSSATRATRGAAKKDCTIPFIKTTFSQAVFSFRASQQWNTVPQSVRESPSYHSFKVNTKDWLVDSQTCEHY